VADHLAGFQGTTLRQGGRGGEERGGEDKEGMKEREGEGSVPPLLLLQFNHWL